MSWEDAERGQAGRRNCLMSPAVWGACVWASLSESDSTHLHSMDASRSRLEGNVHKLQNELTELAMAYYTDN